MLKLKISKVITDLFFYGILSAILTYISVGVVLIKITHVPGYYNAQFTAFLWFLSFGVFISAAVGDLVLVILRSLKKSRFLRSLKDPDSSRAILFCD